MKNETKEFVWSKIEHKLTFTCFDHKRSYSINEISEWMDEHAREKIRNVLLGLCYEMQDEKMDKHYDILVKTLEKYPRKMKDITINVDEIRKMKDDSITDPETIRQIALTGDRTLFPKVMKGYEHHGLYPHAMKKIDILPDEPKQPPILLPEEKAKSFLEWAEKGWAIDKAYNSSEKEGQESSSWNVVKPYFERKLTELFKEFSHDNLLEYVYDETRVSALAEIYKRSVHDAAIVADICDNVIDRSGKLLGEVRKIVRA